MTIQGDLIPAIVEEHPSELVENANGDITIEFENAGVDHIVQVDYQQNNQQQPHVRESSLNHIPECFQHFIRHFLVLVLRKFFGLFMLQEFQLLGKSICHGGKNNCDYEVVEL